MEFLFGDWILEQEFEPAMALTFFSRKMLLVLWITINNFRRSFRMLFKKTFVVVEIRNSGVTLTHYLIGSRKEINESVKKFKMNSKKFQLVGKNGMIVWV